MNRHLRNPLLKVPLRYGVIGGAIGALLFMILYYLGENPLVFGRPWDFGFLLIPIMIFFGMKDFKVNHNRGELRFWQGMTAGFLVYTTIAIISALFIFVFLSWWDTTVLEGYIIDRLQLLQESQEQFTQALGEDLYHQQISKTKQTTASVLAWDDFWKKLSIGLFLTIIIAVILRN